MSDNATELEEPNEMLATRRPKRSTAGNRMEAALAEMALEENKEVDDDKDFEILKDEEDVFGSDFESTDEEAENVVAEAGESAIVDEERRARKAAKSRLEKVTAAAHARNKETFNADVGESSSAKPTPKPKLVQRRVMGLTIRDSGEMLESTSVAGSKRTSQRKHTIMNTSATVTRLKESQKKKAAQPKKAKMEVKRYTQAQLIARALDNEEGNIVQHRDYLKNEEEKRKRARVVRTTVQGPLLRWISKEGEDKVVVPPPPPNSTSVYKNIHSFIPSPYSYAASGSTFNPNPASTSQSTGSASATLTSNLATSTQFQTYRYYNDPAASAFPMWPPPSPQSAQHQPYYPLAPTTTTTPTPTVPAISTPSDLPDQPATTASPGLMLSYNPIVPVTPQPPPDPETRIEKVSKNYLVHELAQVKGTSRPNWVQSMQAMFGDHVKWDEIKVFSGKNRPLSRPRHTCPISGMQAHYFDPRTGVPYADSQAYKILTEIFDHHYEWSASLGCYVGKDQDDHEAMVVDDT